VGPRYVGPVDSATVHFHRERQWWPAGGAPVLKARPVVSSPALDGFAIGLPCSTLRFLRRDAAIGEPGVEVAWVVLDAPLASNHVSDSACGPQFGAEAKGPGVLAEPTEDLADLCAGHLGGPARMGLGVQAVGAVASESRPPMVDSAKMNLEEIGHFAGRVTFLEFLDRESSPPLQLGRRAGCSHAPCYVHESTGDVAL